MGELGASLCIQLFAYAVFRYRSPQTLSPDSKFYAAMAEGFDVPSPYARRWLLPKLLKNSRAWNIASGVAFVASGPLVYDLTGSLACVWLWAWLPGMAINVRLPVLVDQCALTAMLCAAVLCKHDLQVGAMLVLFAAAQMKESAAVFGGLLCGAFLPWVGAGLGLIAAMGAGVLSPAEQDQEYMQHPFRVARTKHDPLCWRSMLLPWGSVVVLGVWGVEQGLPPPMAMVVAGVSLCVGYGQLLIANDESRLYQWAAPAVLIAMGGVEGAWVGLALVAHPFLCGAAKRA